MTKKLTRLTAAVLVIATMSLGLAVPAAAATVTADCSSDPSALGTAIADADPGDTIEVKGTCVGTFTLDTALTLRGKTGNAILDGDGAGPVVTVAAGVTAVLEELTVTGGVGSGPVATGGITNNGDLTLTKTTVTGNSANATGSSGIPGVFAIAISGVDNFLGTLTLDRSEVTANTATAIVDVPSPAGDTAIAVGGINNTFGTVTLTKSEVSGNTSIATATVAATGAGAVARTFASHFGSLSMDDTRVSGNTATAVGSGDGSATGGLANNFGPMTISNSEFRHNTATGSGATGGISYVGGDPGTISNTTVSDNTASGSFLVFGGISYFDDAGTVGGSLTLDNSMVNGNEADSDFVAVGGVGHFGEESVLHIIDTKIEKNTAHSDVNAVSGGVSSFDLGLGGFDPNNIDITDSKIKNNDPFNCDFVHPDCDD